MIRPGISTAEKFRSCNSSLYAVWNNLGTILYSGCRPMWMLPQLTLRTPRCGARRFDLAVFALFRWHLLKIRTIIIEHATYLFIDQVSQSHRAPATSANVLRYIYWIPFNPWHNWVSVHPTTYPKPDGVSSFTAHLHGLTCYKSNILYPH